MFEEIRAEHFPAELVSGVTVHAVDERTIEGVWKAISAEVFSAPTGLGNYVMPKGRRERSKRLRDLAAQNHSEHFVFYSSDGYAIGWSSGIMLDSSTFFMSYSGILPAYQRQGIYSGFLEVFLRYLHALGFERVTSNHMVNNRAVLIAKLKAGFFITGTVLDERWGAQVGLTYFFYEDRRQGFAQAYGLEQYSGVPQYLARD